MQQEMKGSTEHAVYLSLKKTDTAAIPTFSGLSGSAVSLCAWLVLLRSWLQSWEVESPAWQQFSGVWDRISVLLMAG